MLGTSRAVLERREAEQARPPKSFQTNGKSMMFASWRLLGSALGGLGASWIPLAPCGGYFGVFDRSFNDSGPSWTVLELLGHS
eukprot:7940906-Pyramimonas_sp.AAC.1